MACYKISVEPVIAFYFFVYMIYYSVIPQLLLHKVCLRENDFNSTLCLNNISVSTDVQRQASRWWFYNLLLFQVPGIFTVLFIGPLTDILGRYKALLAFPCIDALSAVVFLINSYYVTLHPALLMPAFFLWSLYGGSPGVSYLCYAFLADIEDRGEHRTNRMALAIGSTNVSGALAFLFSGYLLGYLGYNSIFIMIIIIDVIIFLYVYFNLSKDSQQALKLKKISVSSYDDDDEEDDDNDDETSLTEANTLMTDDTSESLFTEYCTELNEFFKIIRENKIFKIMIFVFMCIFFGHMGEHLITSLYLKSNIFSFSPQEIGLYGAVLHTSRAIGVILLAQLSLHVFHFSDYIVILIGALSQMTSYIILASSNTKLIVFIAGATSFAMPLSMSTIRAMLTKHVPKNRYGASLSLLGSFSIAVSLVSNAVIVWAYELTLAMFGGLVFLGLAVISAIAIVVVFVTYLIVGKNQ